MNNYLYERITNELNGLSDSDLFPSKVRNKLDYDLHLYSPRNDFVAVLVAYYEFMKNNISYEVLTNYCKETFSKFFNTEYISNNYEGIINDEKILNLVIELCSADAIKELFSHYLDDEKTYNMLKDLCEKYGKEVPVKSNKEEETQNSNDSDETKKEYNEDDYDFDLFSKKKTNSEVNEELTKVQDEINKNNLEYQRVAGEKYRQGANAYSSNSPEEYRKLADKIDELDARRKQKEELEDKKRNLENEAVIARHNVIKEGVHDLSDAGMNVSFKDMSKKVSGYDIRSFDSITISPDMIKRIEENDIASSMKLSKFQKFINRISSKLQLKTANLEVSDIDSKELVITDTRASQKIASCSKSIIERISKAKRRREILKQFFVSVKEKGVKEVIKEVASMNALKAEIKEINEEKKLSGQEEYDEYKEAYDSVMNKTDKLLEELQNGTVKAIGGNEIDKIPNPKMDEASVSSRKIA